MPQSVVQMLSCWIMTKTIQHRSVLCVCVCVCVYHVFTAQTLLKTKVIIIHEFLVHADEETTTHAHKSARTAVRGI